MIIVLLMHHRKTFTVSHLMNPGKLDPQA